MRVYRITSIEGDLVEIKDAVSLEVMVDLEKRKSAKKEKYTITGSFNLFFYLHQQKQGILSDITGVDLG